MISVVIPTYNRAALLPRAVESALTQQDVSVEVLICDDGSEDGTRERWIQDARVRYLPLPHRGACAARNAGIAAASGEYIAFLDSDDTWRPDKLRIQLEQLQQSGADAVCCAFHRHDGTQEVSLSSERPSGPVVKDELLSGNFISTQTIFGRTEVLRQVLFDEALPRLQDWEYAMRLSEACRLMYFDTPLADVYLQSDSISKRPELGLTALSLIYKRHHDAYLHSLSGTLGWQRFVYRFTAAMPESRRDLYALTLEKERPLADRMKLHAQAFRLQLRHHIRRKFHRKEDIA